jgi:hypothetical protein
MASGPNYILLM